MPLLTAVTTQALLYQGFSFMGRSTRRHSSGLSIFLRSTVLTLGRYSATAKIPHSIACLRSLSTIYLDPGHH